MNPLIIVHHGRRGCVHIQSPLIPAGVFGPVTRIRASHILPVNRLKRLAFRCLRWTFGERGRIAAWTRSWSGPWQVRWAHDLGAVAYIHPSRRACLDWEHRQLNARLVEHGF